MKDLDQGGYGYQRIRTYLGPSLGWIDELVQPATEITVGGIYDVKAGDSLILVDQPPLSDQSSDVTKWVQQPGYQPATALRSINYQDLGHNAANFNIVVAPFGEQSIDNLKQRRFFLLLAQPLSGSLIDMSGWAMAWPLSPVVVEAVVAMFKVGNNTYTGLTHFRTLLLFRLRHQPITLRKLRQRLMFSHRTPH